MRAWLLSLALLGPACGDTVADVVVSPGTPAGAPCSEETCSTERPHCDSSPQRCVECRTSVDCTRDEALVCDPVRKECVECLDDSYCRDPGERCAPGLGRCAVPCQAEADCAIDEETTCSPGLGICVECSTDTDCRDPGEPVCRRAECGPEALGVEE